MTSIEDVRFVVEIYRRGHASPSRTPARHQQLGMAYCAPIFSDDGGD